jgi:hypothetical protein
MLDSNDRVKSFGDKILHRICMIIVATDYRLGVAADSSVTSPLQVLWFQ